MVPRPAEWFKVGETEAAAAGWKLDPKLSGSKYGIVKSEAVKKTEPPLFDSRNWDFDGNDKLAGNVSITVVGPQWPKLKVNSCTVTVKGEVRDKLLIEASYALNLAASELKDIFGGAARGWVFENGIKGASGKLRFTAASQQQLQGGAASLLSRVEWDIPKGRKGMPQQGFGP